MISLVRRLLILALFLPLLACGGGGGSSVAVDTGGNGISTPPPTQQTGAILVRNVLARAVPTGVSEIRATVFDATGRLVHGPTSHPRAGEFRLENVPTAGVTLNLSYLQGSTVIGVGNTPVVIRVGETTVVENPSFEDVAAALRSLRVTPESSTLAVGTQVRLSVLATYSDGTQLDVSTISNWRALSPSILTIASDGLVTAAGLGSSEVEATLGPLSARAEIEVTAAVPISVSVTPSALRLANGTTGRLRAFAAFSDGTQQEVTEAAEWSVASDALASANSLGEILAQSPGQTSVTATFRGFSASSEVEVTAATPVSLSVTPANSTVPIGLTQLFQAVVTLSDGTSQNVTGQTEWSSLDTALASVDSSGLAVGRSVGNTSIKAIYRSLQAEATLQMSDAVLAGIEIEPNSLTLADGTSGTVQVLGLYSDGSELDVTALTNWMTSEFASVDRGGKVQALALGSSTVEASFGGFSASLNVAVTPATLVAIEVSPGALSLPRGAYQSYIATGVYSNGARQSLGPDVIWSTRDSTIAQVDPLGKLVGREVGTTTVVATRGAITGSADVEVTDAIPVSLSVTPSAAVMALHPIQFVANLIYSDGASVDVTDQVTWSANGKISLSESGLARPFGEATWMAGVNDFVSLTKPIEGAATISASLSGLSTTVELVVSLPNALTGLYVNYRGTVSTPGTTRRFTARTYETPLQDVTSVLEWSSNNPDFVSRNGGVFDIAPTTPHGSSAYVRGELENSQSFNIPVYFNRFLFVSTATGNAVHSFQVEEDGHLRLLSTQPSGTYPIDLAIFPSGRDLYSADFTGRRVTRYSVALDGTLSPSTSFDLTGTPNSLAITSEGDLLVGGDYLSVIRQPRPFWGSSSPAMSLDSRVNRAITLDPLGRFLFTPQAQNLVVFGLTRNTGGNLSVSQVASLPYVGQFEATALAPSTNGEYLFVTSNSSSRVHSFRVESNGALTAVNDVATGTYPRGIAVHPTQQVAYVSNYTSNTLSIYDIAANGALSRRTNVAVGNGPRTVRLDPGGKFLYLPLMQANQVASYEIGTDGSLTLIDTVSVPGAPFDLVTNP